MPAPKKNKYAVGHGEGRPEKYDIKFIENEAKLLDEWIQKPQNIWYYEFAIQRGYPRQQLTEFSEKSKVFSDSMALAKEAQEIKLLNGGLRNEYNASIVKFSLANHHGYREKQEVSGNAASPFALLLQQVDGSSKTVVPQDDN
jgi:hypothetical protein